MNLPIPVKTLEPPLNGRSSLIRLWSSGPVYVASLARFAPHGGQRTRNGHLRLKNGRRSQITATWRNHETKTPTPPEQTTGQIIYGRVAGVARGSRWNAQIVDPPGIQTSDRTTWYLTIPQPGQAFSYGLSTLAAGYVGYRANSNRAHDCPLSRHCLSSSWQLRDRVQPHPAPAKHH